MTCCVSVRKELFIILSGKVMMNPLNRPFILEGSESAVPHTPVERSLSC